MKIEIEISDADVIALKNDLLDIEKWVVDAVKGKVANCKSRLVNTDGPWMQSIRKDETVTTLPAKVDDLVAFICSRPDYKDRAAREAEAKAAEEAKRLSGATGNDVMEIKDDRNSNEGPDTAR